MNSSLKTFSKESFVKLSKEYQKVTKATVFYLLLDTLLRKGPKQNLYSLVSSFSALLIFYRLHTIQSKNLQP